MGELRNVNISYVSLVDKAANKKKFAIVKNEDGNFENYCPIIKQNEDKQEVTAVVYEPLIKDAHDDYMTAEEIEKAQRSHALNGFGSDIQHNFMKENKLHLVESWITKQDGKIGDQEVKKGTWVQTLYVEDRSVWDKIKKGELTGFSMGGVGERVQKSISGNTNLSIDEESSWDSAIAEKEIWDYAKDSGGNIIPSKAKQCFMWFNPDMQDTQSGWKLPFCNIVSGKPVASRAALIAISNALSDARGGVDIPQSDIDTIKNKIKKFSSKMKNPIPAFSENNNVEKSLLQKMAVFFGNDASTDIEKATTIIEKAGKKISNKNMKSIKEAYMKLGELINNIEEEEGGIFKMEENKIQEMINTAIQKALNPEPKIEDVVQKAVEKAMGKTTNTGEKPVQLMTEEEKKKKKEEEEAAKIKKSVDQVLKSLGLEQKEETFEEKVAKAVAKALEPVQEQVTKMAESRGFTKVTEPIAKQESQPVIQKSYIKYE